MKNVKVQRAQGERDMNELILSGIVNVQLTNVAYLLVFKSCFIQALSLLIC